MELKLENVTKKYGEKVALDGFSYTFTPEFTESWEPTAPEKAP